jgi:hypothetical protein
MTEARPAASTGPGGKVNRSGFSRFLLLANETADEHLSRPAGALSIKSLLSSCPDGIGHPAAFDG